MKPSLTSQRHPHPLLDAVIRQYDLKNDAALCKALGISPPRISKIRRGKLSVSADIVLRLHERFQISVAELRRLQQEPEGRRGGAAFAGAACLAPEAAM